MPSLLGSMSALVAAPSVSCVEPRIDQGNRAVVELLAGWLADLGFAIDLQQVGDRADKVNLVATLGRGDGGLVLAGHADTVPFDPARWQHDPFALTEDGGRLYGLGTTDMKGFLAMVVDVARQLDAARLVHPLVVVATADEETSMAGARALARRGLPGARHALIGEPTSLRPVRLHKGLTMEAVRVIGRSGHSSDPALGRNALEGMHAVMGALLSWRAELARRYRDDRFDVAGPTLNLAALHGGDNPNRICGECELLLDLRLLPGMDLAALRAELRDRVAGVLEGRGLEHEVRSLVPGLDALETAPAAPIVRAVEELTGVEAGSIAFGTEGPHLASMGIDVVVLGPGDVAIAHQPDEHLRLDRIAPTLELLQGLVRRFCLSPA